MTRRGGGGTAAAAAAWPSSDRSSATGDRCCRDSCAGDFLVSLRVLPIGGLPAGVWSTLRSADWLGGNVTTRFFAGETGEEFGEI